MKTKVTLLLIVTAMATLSFTYVATHDTKTTATSNSQPADQREAIGGFVSEEN